MKFNIFKFYRLDFCLRNLGLGIVGIVSVDNFLNLKLSFLALLNLLLIQMHSFSMNNYFDFKIWGEENYIGKLINEGFNLRFCLFLTILPLIILMIIITKYNSAVFLLFVYIILFYLYQAPPFRLKNYYLSSIIINSICLGSILYLYPYIFLAHKCSFIAISFALIFFFYLGFHELVHQIAHFGKDKICSLPHRIGMDRTVMVVKIFLIIPILIGIGSLMLNPFKYLVFVITISFSVFRLYKLSKIKPTQKNFLILRNTWHKFYSFYEGVLYVIILSLWR